MKFISFTLLSLLAAVSAAGGSRQDAALQVGKPVISGTVMVVPILAARQPSDQEYISLTDASAKGLVHISDTKPVSAGYVLVTNDAKAPLLIPAGSLLQGGHQDQVVSDDQLIPSGVADLVPVFCVEPSRSRGGEAFKAADLYVPDWMRVLSIGHHGPSAMSSTQSQIWNEVAKINRFAGRAPKGELLAALSGEDMKSFTDALALKIDAELDNSDRVVGAMICLDGKILSADIYANHQLFARMRTSLLKTYALDARLARSLRVPSLEDCAAFLDNVVRLTGSGFRQNAPISGSELVAPTGFVHGYYWPRS